MTCTYKIIVSSQDSQDITSRKLTGSRAEGGGVEMDHLSTIATSAALQCSKGSELKLTFQ